MNDMDICKCGNEFQVQRRNGIKISKLCPDCRYLAELNKRREQINAKKQSIVKQPNIAVKSRKVDYSKMTVGKLNKLAERHFNKFIRNRDELPGKTFFCPTCKTHKRIIGRQYQACHCFPAGKFSALKFNEKNVFGGCLACNYFQHGTNYIYNDWVRNKIGEEEYSKLQRLSNSSGKLSRFELIHIIETYKAKNKLFKPTDLSDINEGNLF